jgi:hypothetical protein
MTKVACVYEYDVPLMVVEDYSISCYTWIALRGTIKIEFNEIYWGGRPKGGVAERGGRRSGG